MCGGETSESDPLPIAAQPAALCIRQMPLRQPCWHATSSLSSFMSSIAYLLSLYLFFPLPLSLSSPPSPQRLVYGAHAEAAHDLGFDSSHVADAIRGTSTFQKHDCCVKRILHPDVARVFWTHRSNVQIY